jgi:hypothetical protein
MFAHAITYKTLNEAIRIAFSKDENILSLYDPTKKVECLEDIVEDISRKIKEYDDGELTMQGVYEKNNLIGYFVYRHKLLISFSLNIRYRIRKYLNKFFQLIKERFKGTFHCILFSRNIRAIKWLIKNNMQIGLRNDLITQLIYN